MLSFFILLQQNAKGKKKIIMRNRMQRLKRALAIDRPILVIKCHVKIPSVTLFSCLKTKHEGKLIAHSVKQPDMLNL